MSDTIFALATAPGRSAVAVVRLSGPDASAVLRRLAETLPRPRVASVRYLRAPETNDPIDQALVLWMPGPNSFTGENVVELHLHGGRAVVAAATQALIDLGCRPADPGEFTRRAFERGRLDLSEAEAVADLVDAETEAQRRQALAQLDGALARRAASWRSSLIDALAGLEAAIDFPDEDLPETVIGLATPPLTALRKDLRRAAGDTRGERVREGFRIALIGAPNAGKSSLLNQLVGRDAAIVTEIAGTTRDVIEVTMDIDGYRVVLADTAGMRETTDVVEKEGVKRARQQAEDADLRLWVVDRNGSNGAWREATAAVRHGDLLVLTKADLQPGRDEAEAASFAGSQGAASVVVSTRGSDLAILTETLKARVSAFMAGSEAPTLSRERHRIAIQEALTHLDRALVGADPELMAEDVRLAARALERISGRIDSEAVLDRVFSAFCIGK